MYQVVVSLGKPFQILSFDGPFKGSCADVSIFRATILPELKENERIMCDKGYRQEPRCWCPPTGELRLLSAEEKAMRRKVTRVRHLNERMIQKIKDWGCMSKRWNNSWKLHEMCAHIVVRLINLTIVIFPSTLS